MSEHVLPVYVVCDKSYSMIDHVDALNVGLRSLHHAVSTDHRVVDKTWLCLIGFSSTASVEVPLAKLSELAEVTGGMARAASNYAAAFTLLRHTIENDVEALGSSGHTVYRPVVFFLSDGQPTDPASWLRSHERLTDESWPARPHIVALGIGDADSQTLEKVATLEAFLSWDGVTSSAVVQKLAGELPSSIVLSGGPAPDIADGLPNMT